MASPRKHKHRNLPLLDTLQLAATYLEDGARDTALQLVKEAIVKVTPQPGTCRYCGCTEDDPCHLDPDGDGLVFYPCAWQDNEETVCTNTRCLDKYFAEKRAEKAKKK